ncbi:hypothetical protein C1646_771186 [Rhizophagus diaphanus]|nr:hypothetical protein C1646_771186 [Rhizophagus diaphanus] [Rhizophagus sp. MUCL 43196]
MSNVYILKDINNRGHRLGSAYKQELKKKLRTTIDFNSKIIDFNEKLQADYSEYLESQLISEQKSHSESQRELEAKYSAKIKLLKSNIKTLKREATLTQKASSADKIKILSLETKVCELEGKLDDLELKQVFYDSNAVGGMIEDLAQSDPKEIDSLRLELERVKEDLNSKEYTIECMEKGKEASDNIYKRELDIWSSERLKLIEKNTHFQELLSKKDNEVDTPSPSMNNSSCTAPSGQPSTLNPLSQIISVGGAEVVSLPVTAPIIASSSMSPMLIYSILTLVFITIICFMARKWWNSWKKSDQYFSHENYEDRSGIIPNHLPYKYWC